MNPFVTLVALCTLVLPNLASSAEESAPIRMLLLGGSGGGHQPAEFANALVPPLAQAGIRVTYTEDVDQLARDNLAGFDVLAIFKDNGELTAGQESALVSMVEEGKGLIAVHCASHCFRESDQYTKLVGGRFDRHGHASFRAAIIDAQHPSMRGLTSFETRDETYVHDQLADDIQVLMARENEGGYEPYAWVRKQGQGRVFYTALGHDERTWRQPGFQRLIVNASRWAAGISRDEAPAITIEDGKPLPLAPGDSMKHMHLPEGFRVELFAAEPDIVKPIAMTFDARGRLWIIESTDYPNNVLPNGQGHDRIKICEDTDGDGRADKFTIFADRLNIPTSLHPFGDGVLVAAAPDILFLRDTDGDDRADAREVLYTGFGRSDTHAVHSNFRYGLDNWIWATIGYSGAEVKVGDKVHRFAAGVFRFRPDGTELEVLTPTQSNTWGLGFNEAGDPFLSKANDDHSLHLAIPNRYFEMVRGWHGVGNVGIADHKRFHPVSDDIRQVDWHGGYTAASGQTVYAASSFPEAYRDRAAFVCEPTGHLIHVDFLVPHGTSFVARDGFNLLASTDPWTAPIETQVGPDGALWFIDWYNYIVRHNPTPPGYTTGIGNAYVTPDRDQSHGRIYRIVHASAPEGKPPRLSQASIEDLVAALGNDNQWWRMTAQRLLVERRGEIDFVPLARMATGDDSRAAMHALAALAGRGAFQTEPSPWLDTLHQALEHSSSPARRAALQFLPRTAESAKRILSANVLSSHDRPLQLAALLALAEMPGSMASAHAVAKMLSDPDIAEDRWLPIAAVAALAPSTVEFLTLTLSSEPGSVPAGISPTTQTILRILSEHYARGKSREDLPRITHGLAIGPPAATVAVIEGLLAGWPERQPIADPNSLAMDLVACLERTPPEKQLSVLLLARRWGVVGGVEEAVAKMMAAMKERLADVDSSEEERLEAARRLAEISEDGETLAGILASVTPKTSPEYAMRLFNVLERNTSPRMGTALVARWRHLTPGPRRAALDLLLRRPAWTKALLDAMESGIIDRSDLAMDQAQQLLRYPESSIAERARLMLALSNTLPSEDRRKVLADLLPVAKEHGEENLGREVFEKNCAKCHRFNGVGQSIGPELTGIAARTREDILADILDPNRSVEGNFRQYTVATTDGLLRTGLLLSESRTAIELLDSQAEKHVLLRDDIEEMTSSKLSVMPEGFEKLSRQELASLLDFLTARGKYYPLPLGKAATIVTTLGMFYDRSSPVERLICESWGKKEAFGVPFYLIDPRDDRIPNAILLHGPAGAVSREMPSSVRVPCNAPAKALHLLGGVSGWGFPASPAGTVSMIVRLHYVDGTSEDHPLVNGVHLADYIRAVDVPGSKLAFRLRSQQLRYLTITPRRADAIKEIEFLKGPDSTAPLVMAVTAESP